MIHALDIDRYFERIGFRGSARADLETLRALQCLHPQAIAFENLDPLSGRPVQLDLASVQRKLLEEARGGYCFEHNGLLQAVLRALGFQLTPLGARVVWAGPPELPARTHSLSLVELEGVQYLVDVGFGSMTPTAPLRLELDVEQITPNERMRIRRVDGDYVVEALTEQTWRAMYRFDLQPQLPSDYAVANWWVSTHPQSHFTHRLGAAIVAPGRRYTLRGAEFAVHDMQQGTTRTRIDSVAALRTLLAETFRIRLPDEPRLESALERMVSEAAGG